MPSLIQFARYQKNPLTFNELIDRIAAVRMQPGTMDREEPESCGPRSAR